MSICTCTAAVPTPWSVSDLPYLNVLGYSIPSNPGYPGEIPAPDQEHLDGQDVTLAETAGVDPRLIWSLQVRSQHLAFYPVVKNQKKGLHLILQQLKMIC